MKPSVKKYLFWTTIVATFCLFVIFFHACSDAKLLRQSAQSSIQTIKQAKTSGNFCVGNPSLTYDSLNIIFVVDMSYSNIGGKASLRTTPTDPGVLDSLAPKGERFKLIRDFLDNPCIATNPNNTVAVVGFSDTTLLSGLCDQTQLANITSNRTKVNSEISYLEDIQSSDKPLGINSIYMNNTHYLEGLGCAQKIISAKLTNTPPPQRNNQAYLVMFLTDGMPNDPQWVDGNHNLIKPLAMTGIDTAVQSITGLAGTNMAGSSQVVAIEYGISHITASEKTDAGDLLGEMGIQGGGYGFFQSDQAIQLIPLCSLLGSTRKTHFDVLSFGVVNLTAKMVKGVLLPDSDMDGLTDAEETAPGMNFNPQSPRSGTGPYGSRLLDGLCPKGLPASSCQASAIPCSIPNSTGLTTCDLNSQNVSNMDGLDSDRDGLPDIVEVTKGSLINFNDTAFNNDGDSMNLMSEILLGRDPFSWDDDLPSEFLVKYVNYPSDVTPTCPTLDQQPYTFNVDNIPLVQTLSVNLSPADTANFVPDLSHKKNENVIFIYYIIGQSLTGTSLTKASILMGQFVKVSYDDQIVQVGKFNNLGPLDGNPNTWKCETSTAKVEPQYCP